MLAVKLNHAKQLSLFVNPEDHLHLVKFIVGKFVSHRIPIEDTDEYGEGVVGLIEAVDSFSPNMGLFSTYASKCIRNRVISYFRKTRRKEVPLEDSIEENLKDTEIEPEEVPTNLPELLAPYNNDTEKDKKNKEILKKIYIEGKSGAEIARELGVTREYVRQCKVAGLDLLKNRFFKGNEQ